MKTQNYAQDTLLNNPQARSKEWFVPPIAATTGAVFHLMILNASGGRSVVFANRDSLTERQEYQRIFALYLSGIGCEWATFIMGDFITAEKSNYWIPTVMGFITALISNRVASSNLSVLVLSIGSGVLAGLTYWALGGSSTP